MEKKVYLNILYDYYKELFTEKQQNYFEDYYHNDLSLSEIAENYNVSRNAVHNQLKIVENRLNELESILKMYHVKEEVINLLTGSVDKKTIEKIEDIM